MKIGVVIPVYNERATLAEIVARVERAGPPLLPSGEACPRVIVLVDDASSDGSADVVRELAGREGVAAAFHERNRGKGAAIRFGLARAAELGCDVVLIQDADLEYDPADHAALLRPILDGRADAVIGSRFLGQTHRVLYFWHSVANRGLTLLSNMLTNLNLTDVECCLKAFRADLSLRLTEDRFGIEPELIAKLARARRPDGTRARIYEVPVSYSGRTYAEGKKITWRDGVSAVRAILKHALIR